MQIHPCRRFVDFVSDAWRLLRTHACSEEGSSLGPSPKHFIALDPQNNLPTILREQFFNFFEFILTNFVVWPSRAQNIPFCWYSCLLFWLQGQSLADEVEMEKQVNDPLRVWFEALNDEDPPLPRCCTFDSITYDFFGPRIIHQVSRSNIPRALRQFIGELAPGFVRWERRIQFCHHKGGWMVASYSWIEMIFFFLSG